ncbi:hypothetical protein T492DRAFT_878828 [Pavlovales sp. CCMP2436]|nr:hypothetical protein T492DRAFT_878828 [Pavlovales sp. CCMP2436]
MGGKSGANFWREKTAAEPTAETIAKPTAAEPASKPTTAELTAEPIANGVIEGGGAAPYSWTAVAMYALMGVSPMEAAARIKKQLIDTIDTIAARGHAQLLLARLSALAPIAAQPSAAD